MQNTKQVLDWDNKDIFKRKREFYLDEDLVDKIDSIEYGAQVNKIEEIEVNWVPVEPDESKTVKLKIPRVINAVTSDSESDALSAAMGKYLYTLISEWWGWGWGWEYTAWKWISIVWNVISNTLPWAAVSSTAPSNPTKWMIWYDTTNDELKTYDWSQWNVTGKEYNAWEWIAIWQWLDYSAMRWPCDEWFHVPSVDECNFILRASYAYPQTPNYFIKAPSNWYIKFWNAWNYDVGFTLRTRNDQWLNSDEAYLFSYDASDEPHIQPLVIRPKSIWAWVRWFANIPVEADEAWTVLYDGLRWTFYWNEELWLISVYSKENDNWLTLQDKNVWAENVWDNWYYFQWWNNYWFTNASEATSSEKVDASWYAPSTYNEPPINTRYDWSSVRNPDLWWWVTWAVTIDNVISNTWVLSVNWQTWHVTVASPDLSNYLAKNNTTSFTPTGDYNPSTKKYVDDSVSAISVPTNVSDLTNDSNFQTATQVSQAISTAVSSAYKYKWSVASYSNLPASGNTEGDVWNVTDTGMNYAWTWSAWDALGATVDFSNYIAKDNTTAFTPTWDYNPATKKYVDDYVDDNIVILSAWTGISITNDVVDNTWVTSINAGWNTINWDVFLDAYGTWWIEVDIDQYDSNIDISINEKDFTFLESDIRSNWVWAIIDNYTLRRPSKLQLTTVYSMNYSTPSWTVLDITSVDTNRKIIIAEWVLKDTHTSWIYAWKDFLFVYEITYDNSQNVVNTYQREYHIFNPWWTLSPGNVLTYTWNGVYWWSTPTWWITNNTTWTTYTLQEEWVWEESQFNQLSNFWNIIYNVIE